MIDLNDLLGKMCSYFLFFYSIYFIWKKGERKKNSKRSREIENERVSVPTLLKIILFVFFWCLVWTGTWGATSKACYTQRNILLEYFKKKSKETKPQQQDRNCKQEKDDGEKRFWNEKPKP